MGPHFAGGDAGKCDDEMRPRGEERHPWVSQGAATTLGYWGQFSRGPFDTLARAGHCPPQAARWASLRQSRPPWSGLSRRRGLPCTQPAPQASHSRPETFSGGRCHCCLRRPARGPWRWPQSPPLRRWLSAPGTAAFSPGHAGAGGSRGSLGSAASSASHSAGRVLRPWPARQGARPPPRVVAPQAVTHVLSAAVRGVGFTRGGHPVGSVSP